MINDEYFLAALRLSSGHDPIPRHVSATAREAFALRVPHALTAAPAECSAVRGVRDDDGSHLVRFVAAGLTFDLEVTEGDGLIDVAGLVSPYPGDDSLVDVRTPHMTLTRRIGPTGHFAVTGLPPGWISVVCHRPGLAPVQTTWVRIRP
ncbi:hypothetical protein SAMN05421874_13126 [Nonomuraea maritima]|jgi:hypothetical protein|uniref:Uncharacterized protein n=1 Tax=Nonomuraea maritima TaxID=683260 RepID=A0A1G9NKU1_9ACTN|nr:hypothetical protein [Nonomuraea maritima]SDL86647.1 hypothetical protein SAMN05421874_13126 [Nonomuraea maritima]